MKKSQGYHSQSVSEAQKTYRSDPFFEEAVMTKGWWSAHQFLILRRVTQLLILMAFSVPIVSSNITLFSEKQNLSPLTSLNHYDSLLDEGNAQDAFWIVKGTLANSEVLHTIPLGDPYVFSQSFLAQNIYTLSGFLGVTIVTLFYFLFGGRTYCSFVCPVNIVTDAAAWIRRQLRITNRLSISKNSRDLLLVLTLILSGLFQVIAWEFINPVTGLFRAIVYGGMTLANIGVVIVLIIFVMDIIGASNLWCGHLCPVGAFYGILGKKTPLKIKAVNVEACDSCMDCYKVCPEPHVLKPFIQTKQDYIDQGLKPSVLSGDCTRCGRCIDVCPERVFGYSFSLQKIEVVASEKIKKEG